MFRIDERLMIRVAPFGMDLVLSSYYLAAPLLLIELKANPVELGLIGSITAAVHMMLAHRTGPLSDRFGRRRLILLGPLLFTLSCLLAAITNHVKVILLLSALNGLCLSLFWPPLQAWVADLRSASGLARDIGTMNMAWTASHLIGPVLSGFLFGVHPKIPFLFAAGLSSLLFILSYESIHDRPGIAKANEPMTETSSQTWHKNFLYSAWIANFMSWFILGNARYQFPKLARELGSSPQTVGLLVGCLGFSLFLGFFFLRGSDLWHFRRRYLFGAQTLAAMGLLMITLSNSPLLFALALILIGLSVSVTYYSSLLYAVRLSQQKGRGAGFHESILSIGALVGPMLGGLGAHFFNLRIPYLICLFFLLAAIVPEAALLRKKDTTD
ncbi:MAG: MFS transporter [Deltaproteobacteria bacterium]|nr:MFS transporter [Deltaproteobacteria bacterium]